MEPKKSIQCSTILAMRLTPELVSLTYQLPECDKHERQPLSFWVYHNATRSTEQLRKIRPLFPILGEDIISKKGI